MRAISKAHIKAAFLLAIITGAGACSTTSGTNGVPGVAGGGERKEIVGLEEMSLEYIETLWGKADQNLPAGDGRTVRFKGIRTENEDPITEKVDVKYCDVRLDLDKRQLVRKWQYETCRPKT
ncbi:MAG: hypothetical protein EOP07_09920 [Proteobacteria bacterium]|nr:MAG: hypothetical protein EOP07_09920 [Pseudomonadota bacterium]